MSTEELMPAFILMMPVAVSAGIFTSDEVSHDNSILPAVMGLSTMIREHRPALIRSSDGTVILTTGFLLFLNRPERGLDLPDDFLTQERRRTPSVRVA